MTKPHTVQAVSIVDMTLRAASLDETTHSVEAVAATEAPQRTIDRMTGEAYDEVLLMRGGILPEQVPMFDNHAYADRPITTRDQLGAVRAPRVVGDELIVRLFFDHELEDGLIAFRRVKSGQLRNVSIGAKKEPGQVTIIPPRTTRTVDGRAFTAGDLPLHIVRRWRMVEVSLTPLGLDPRAIIRTEANVNTEVDLMSKPATTPATPETTDVQRSDATPPATTPATTQPADVTRSVTPATTPPATQPADVTRSQPTQLDVDTIRRQERERVDAIRSLGSDLNVDETLVTRAVNESWDESRYSREFLQAMRDRRGEGAGADNRAPAGHVRNTDNVVRRQALAAGLMLRNGCRLDHPAFNDPHAQIALRNHGGDFLALEINDSLRQQAMDYAHRYARMSAVDIARHCIELDGRTVPSGSNWEMIIRSAISGGSFSNVFSTDINARLIAAYREKGDTTRGWVAEEDVNDYRNNERPRMEQGVTLTKHPSGATADHVSGSDDMEQYKIFRFSGQFVLDEIDWINDNLRALQEKPNQMAAAARRLRPDLVYYILLANPNMSDGVALYHTDRGNYNASLALASANLKTAIAAFETQQENGINLDLKASHLIVGSKNKHPGLQLVSSQEVRANQNAATEAGTRNTLQDENLTLVSDSRIDNGVTDPNSGTTVAGAEDDWMLMDAMNPAIIVGYLAGTGRSPVLVPWRKNGEDGQFVAGWTVKHSIGAKAIRALSTFKAEG